MFYEKHVVLLGIKNANQLLKKQLQFAGGFMVLELKGYFMDTMHAYLKLGGFVGLSLKTQGNFMDTSGVV